MTLLEQPIYSDEAPSVQLITFEVPTVHNLGIIASMGEEFNPGLFKDARELRARVYIDEKKFLSEESRAEDGGESDQDDNRSVHFVVTESKRTQDGISTSVIGTSRLVLKRDAQDKLPVEKFFNMLPAQTGSVEASRYIARHPNKAVQQMASMALIIGIVNEANKRDADSIYAVVERPLEVRFKWLGIPLERIAPPQFIEEYNTENIAVRFDPTTVIDGIKSRRPSEYDQVKNLVGGL